MKISEFTFDLPPELIAQDPINPRDACRLMVLNRLNKSFIHRHFYELSEFLKAGDVLVMNNSKVIPARIIFQYKDKKAELFLLHQDKPLYWFAIGKPGKILQPGELINIAPGFSFEVENVLPDGQRYIRFHCTEEELKNFIVKYGTTPLPPYIHQSKSQADDYQTVYAKHLGSVAAPTAGLHFTAQLLEKLTMMGVKIVYVTLHVGLGTFQPVKTEEVEEHSMHAEIYELTTEAALELQNAKNEKRRIFAVGTTSVRVLESSYDEGKGFIPQTNETSIYIYPGYQWKCVDGIITNFHLPKSTLLLLISSFAGKDFILKAYQEAISQKYRFYSFGDAMLIM